MDKKVFLAVTLCAGIFLLWQQVYLKPYAEQQQAWNQQQTAAAPATTSQTPAPTEKSEQAPKQTTADQPVSLEKLTVGDAEYNVVLNPKGGVVEAISMGEYRGQKTDNVSNLIGGGQQLELNTPSQDWAYLSNIPYKVLKRGKNAQAQDEVVLGYEDSNVSVQRTYTVVPSLYYVDHETTLKFKKPAPNYVFVGLKTAKNISKEQSENEKRQVFLNKAGGQETWDVASIDELKEDSGQGNWFGFASRYFLNAVVNKSEDTKPQFQARPSGEGAIAAGFFYKAGSESVRIPVRFYYGPKDIDVLKQVGNHLDAAVDFGWFTIFAYPMLKALKWFYKYLHNFGLAIILLTILVKVLTYPLTLKSMKSMKQMQRIQPQIQRLRDRYKDDKEKLNREMLQLMRANGYNPMSGCLPIFIQMPIFIALYNVLYGAIDLYGQPFFGWIHDLSAKDPFYVTPILLALMMFVQQKMTPTTATDPAQQRMMMMMPIIFGFMMLWLPAGLTLYMLVNSVVSILQQVAINRVLDHGASSAT